MCLDPVSRRRFLQLSAASAAVVVAGGAASVRIAEAQTQRGPVDQLTAGMIDFHVHTYPDNFDRTVSAVEATRMAQARGLAGIVLKGGAFETVTRAAEARAAVPGVKVFGGLVMNKPSGGINPAGVEAMANFRGGGSDKIGRQARGWLRGLRHTPPRAWSHRGRPGPNDASQPVGVARALRRESAEPVAGPKRKLFLADCLPDGIQ